MPTKYASFVKRFMAHVIDVIIGGLLGLLILIPFALMIVDEEVIDNLFSFGFGFGTTGIPQAMLPNLFEPWFGPLSPIPGMILVLFFVFHSVLYWLYFSVFESSPRQATPGKMMLGIFVTDINGRRISFPRALARTLSKIFSKMFLYIGYLLALFTERKQALHDLIAGTLVLEPDRQPPQAPVAPPPAVSPSGGQTNNMDGVVVPDDVREAGQPENDKNASDDVADEHKPEQEQK